MSTKRTADVVFCIDASASMRSCFEAVCRHVNGFVDSLRGGNQSAWDVRLDFLAYSASEKPGGEGLFDFRSMRSRGLELVQALYLKQSTGKFFTSDINEFKRALEEVSVSGDEASFVALDTALDYPWRPAKSCHRVIILLTDEALETGVLRHRQIEAIPRLIEKIHSLHALLFVVGPSSIAFDHISAADKSEYVVVDEAQDGLSKVDFAKVFGAMGKSVSASVLQTLPHTAAAPRGLFGQAEWGKSNEAIPDE